MQARQGDLWFRPEIILQDATPVEGRLVLAEGAARMIYFGCIGDTWHSDQEERINRVCRQRA